MKILLIGYGNQGKKRIKLINKKKFKTSIYDPNIIKYNDKSILKREYNYVFLCCSDQFKDYYLINYSSLWKAKILIEKPLLINHKNSKVISSLCKKKSLYVAFNHRYDLAIQKFVSLSKKIKTKYYISFRYFNGGAAQVKQNKWRDKGMGVIYDLFPHLYDLTFLLIQKINFNKFRINYKKNFENISPDFSSITYDDKKIYINYKVSYLSWKNDFEINLYSKFVSLHLKGLIKWGKSQIEVRKRNMFGGKPNVSKLNFNGKDLSFRKETDDFLSNKIYSDLNSIKNITSIFRNFKT